MKKLKELKAKIKAINEEIDDLQDEMVELENEREEIEEEIERLESLTDKEQEELEQEEDDIGDIWKFSEEEVRRGVGLMLKDSTNNTILNVIEDIRALKKDVNGITREDLENMERRLLEGLEEEHNGKVFRKENGR